MQHLFNPSNRRAAFLIASLVLIYLAGCSIPEPERPIDQIAFTSNRAGDANIYLINVDGTQLTQLTHDPAADYRPAWSPDGQRIAFVSERDGNPEIYLMNANGSNQTRLTTDPGIDWFPAWSPDGDYIAFASNREGNFNIYLMSIDGIDVTRYTAGREAYLWPTWAPDGQRLAYHSATFEGAALCILDVEPLMQDTPRTSPLCRGNGLTRDSNPAWSPDGERIAFQRSLQTETMIYFVSANDESSPTPVTQSGNINWFPAWSPDGSQLAYTASVKGDLEIFIIAVDGSGPTPLASDPAIDSYPAWRPRSGQR